MQTKTFSKVLTALLMLGCFFSSSVYSAETKSRYFDTIPTIPDSGYVYATDLDAKDAACLAILAAQPSWFFHRLPSDPASGGNCQLLLWEGGSLASVSISVSSVTCSGFVNSDGTCSVPVDCSANTDTRMLLVTQTELDNAIAGDGTFAQGDCSYQWDMSAQCMSDTECIIKATGTGVAVTGSTSACSVDCNTFTDSGATPGQPQEWLYTKLAKSLWDKIVDTVVNADGSVTDTYTTTSSQANDEWEKITYDGEYFDSLKNQGTTSNTLDVEVVTTLLDGSTISNSTSTTTTSSGGLTQDNINATTGETITTSTLPVQTTTTTTNVMETDVNGDITKNETTSDTKVEEPTDPNDASDVPSADGFVNGDYSVIDNAVESFKVVPDVVNVTKDVTFLLSLNSGGSCLPTDFQFSFWTYSVDLKLCDFIIIIQDSLYWIFYIFLSIYAYHSLVSLGSVKRA